jgi:ribose transport system substrate-binding protein
MVNVFETAAKQAQADGLISGYEVDNAPGANSATAQIAQLQTIILKKPDAILINPASGTALDIVIQQACDAGIIVVVFDSGVTAPCAYKLHNNYSDWGHNSTLPALKAINNQGSVIVVRGVVGSLPETQFYDASKADLAAAPNVKVLATVIGYADDSKTQAAVLGVLGGLPKVDAVIGSVAGLGAARAFQAAGRPIPVVGFGTSGADLAYWKDNNVNNGSFSVLTDPGQSIAAMWEAIDIIAGKTVPKDVHTPLILIPQKDRDAWLKVLGPTQYAWWPWTHDLYEQQVQANANNSADVIPGVPTK